MIFLGNYEGEKTIVWKFENFSQFVNAANRTMRGTRRTSHVVYVRGMGFRILAVLKGYENDKTLGLFLQVEECDVEDWKIFASVRLFIYRPHNNWVRDMQNEFSSRAVDWGFSSVMRLSVLTSCL